MRLPQDIDSSRIQKWRAEDVLRFFTINSQEYQLSQANLGVLKDLEISGMSIFDIGVRDFEEHGLRFGVALRVVKLIRLLKNIPRELISGYLVSPTV